MKSGFQGKFVCVVVHRETHVSTPCGLATKLTRTISKIVKSSLQGKAKLRFASMDEVIRGGIRIVNGGRRREKEGFSGVGSSDGGGGLCGKAACR